MPLERDDVTITVKIGGGLHNRDAHVLALAAGPGRSIARPTSVYVLRSACYENHRAYEQWLRMTQTKNFDEFRHVLEMNAMPMFNICYADRVGNIFYLWNGTVPNLPHPAHKAEAVPRRAFERRLDAVSRDDRAAATVQSAGRLRAKLQLAAVSDEPVRRRSIRPSYPAHFRRQRPEPAHAAQPATGRTTTRSSRSRKCAT